MDFLAKIIIVLVLIFLILGLPLIWMVSEIKNYEIKSRISLGITALVSTFLIAAFFAVNDRLSYSTNYAIVSKSLISTTIVQIENGNTDIVLNSLKKLRSKFLVRAGMPVERYEEIVKEALKSMSSKK